MCIYIYIYIKLNSTYENKGYINFLHLFIIQKPSSLEINIFRKQTTTDTTINCFPNHPIEHKISTFRYHITRTHSFPLIPKKKQKEWTSIKLVARNNNFPQNLLLKLNRQNNTKNSQEQTKERKENNTWTTFTYYSPRIRKLTNLFKHTNVGISFKNTSTVQQLTKPITYNKILEQDKSGIYGLTCNTCQMSYTGQTIRV